MKKLLCIVGGMNAGGAETFLMKIFRTLDKSKYRMDFCVAINYKGYYDDEIESRGGVIHHVPPKTKNPFSSFEAIRKIVREGNYNSVLRISQNSMSCIDLVSARFGGASILGFRSSNSGTCGSKFEDIAHYFFKPIANMVTNVKIAPSTEAAEFMFGKMNIERGKVEILHNGLDVERFKFDKKKRDNIRKILNVEEKFVIGHIGRFNKQKNHEFLIRVFSKIIKVNPNAHLVLVGEGNTESIVRSSVIENNLEKNVTFLGVRSDVEYLMMAFDVLFLPSIFEGMPNVAIEAQCTGLPCKLSDTITKEAKITDLVEFIGLNDYDAWAKSATSIMLNGKMIDREQYSSQVKRQGYSIQDVSDRFIQLFYN